jgi:hypothetical protein
MPTNDQPAATVIERLLWLALLGVVIAGVIRFPSETVRAGAVDPRSGVKCGWANGYQDCQVPGCTFASWKTDERCLLVKRARGEA